MLIYGNISGHYYNHHHSYMRKNLIFICLLVSLSITACTSWLPTPHRIDIQQGNRVKAEALDKLRIGMSRKQVKFVLGTPLLQDSFHKNRWDYVYYFKAGTGEIKQSRVQLDFDGDALTHINRDHYNPEQQVNALHKDGEEQEEQSRRSAPSGGGGHSH